MIKRRRPFQRHMQVEKKQFTLAANSNDNEIEVQEGPLATNEKGMASFPVKRSSTTEIVGESVTEGDRDEYPNVKRHSTENAKAKDVSKEGAVKWYGYCHL